MIDLHVHTNRSDGRLSPEDTVRRAVSLGLDAIAITDHDTIAGIAPARAANGALPIVTGAEISAGAGRKQIHILAYGIDTANHALVEALAEIVRDRHVRAGEIVARLNELGVPLTVDAIISAAGDAPITRAHIATALVRERHVRNPGEAFVRFLSDTSPAFVPHGAKSPANVISIIHGAGGIAVLAHPGLTRCDELVAGMVRAGLDGIEVVHPFHPPSIIRFYRELARKHDLVVTGGSDAHGTDETSDRMGTIGMPTSTLDRVRQRVRARRGYAAGEPVLAEIPIVP